MHALRNPLWVLLLALAVASCGESDATATELRLADLVRFQDRYDGDMIATTGLVRMFDEPEHYWIEDDRVNRIRIVPHDAVSDLVGQRVQVVGRFAHDSETGRVITARRVAVVQ